MAEGEGLGLKEHRRERVAHTWMWQKKEWREIVLKTGRGILTPLQTYRCLHEVKTQKTGEYAGKFKEK